MLDSMIFCTEKLCSFFIYLETESKYDDQEEEEMNEKIVQKKLDANEICTRDVDPDFVVNYKLETVDLPESPERSTEHNNFTTNVRQLHSTSLPFFYNKLSSTLPLHPHHPFLHSCFSYFSLHFLAFKDEVGTTGK